MVLIYRIKPRADKWKAEVSCYNEKSRYLTYSPFLSQVSSQSPLTEGETMFSRGESLEPNQVPVLQNWTRSVCLQVKSSGARGPPGLVKQLCSTIEAQGHLPSTASLGMLISSLRLSSSCSQNHCHVSRASHPCKFCLKYLFSLDNSVA